MAKEIELKLSLPAAQAARLPDHAVLADVAPQKFRLFNTYYDTPGLDLCQRGIALRLRRRGRSQWLMTVKGGDPAAGGMTMRSEWESPVSPGTFDFGIVSDAKLRDFLKSHQEELRPVFTTNFTRTAWRLAPCPGTVIEVALDRGRIAAERPAGGKAKAGEAICELELELVEGTSTDALFDIAIALAADFHLHPAVASKAERGYALAAGKGAGPARFQPPSVARGMPSVEAFRAIAASCLVQLQRNEAGVLAGGDPEFVHQARVAIRRLRSALGLFAPALVPAFIEVYAPRWGALARQLGSARDWDVFIEETLTPLEKNFPGDDGLARLRERSLDVQARAQSSAGEALAQPDYGRLLLAFAAALFRMEPTVGTGARMPGKLGGFAAQRLRKQVAGIRKLARRQTRMDDAHRHRLRIGLKKLRYAVEFFAPLLSNKRLKVYQRGLTSIQDLLGRLNDQVTAERLIGELHPEGGPARLACGWIAGRKHLLIQSLNAELENFLSLRTPW